LRRRSKIVQGESVTRWLGRETIATPHLALCLSESEFKAAAKHCKVNEPGQWLDESHHKACVHTWQRGDVSTCVVCVHPDAQKAEPIEVAEALVHEAVHVFQRLCDSIGEDAPSREFEAYSIERISGELMREFARRIKGKRK